MGLFGVSVKAFELLQDRALRMLRVAEQNLESGHFDLAAFMAEQAVQLFIKSLIFKATGEIPRMRMVRQLLGVFGEISDRKRVEGFVRRNRSLLIRLEEAYISSRYLPRKYEREEAEELVNFAKEVIGFVKSFKV